MCKVVSGEAKAEQPVMLLVIDNHLHIMLRTIEYLIHQKCFVARVVAVAKSFDTEGKEELIN